MNIITELQQYWFSSSKNSICLCLSHKVLLRCFKWGVNRAVCSPLELIRLEAFSSPFSNIHVSVTCIPPRTEQLSEEQALRRGLFPSDLQRHQALLLLKLRCSTLKNNNLTTIKKFKRTCKSKIMENSHLSRKRL